jgi:hypothetical protein
MATNLIVIGVGSVLLLSFVGAVDDAPLMTAAVGRHIDSSQLGHKHCDVQKVGP